ncbi:hypothetical protein ACX93W_26675 [Paenibacillus sp. CAU 1782]
MVITQISDKAYTLEMTIKETSEDPMRRHDWYFNPLIEDAGDRSSVVCEVVDYKGEMENVDGTYQRQYLFFLCWEDNRISRAQAREKVFGEDDVLLIRGVH